MVESERVRVEIGFKGGQVLGTFVDPASADELERALGQDGPRVVVLDAEDGPCHVVTTHVAYLRRYNRSSRVGFS